MTSALPVVSGRNAARALEKAGFTKLPKRGKGSHIVMMRKEPVTIVTVPDHREIDRGTLRAIIRHSGMSVEEFKRLLKK